MIKVCENVYTATGYAFVTILLVVTPGGAVVIDTTESLSAAREVMGELKKITDLPVKVVVYTHNHADHWLGTKAFLAPGETPDQIIVHIPQYKVVCPADNF